MTAADFAPFNDDRPAGIKRRLLVAEWTGWGLGVNTLTVPGHTLWRVLGVAYSLTTSAVVKNRFPRLQFVMDGENTLRVETGITAVASLTYPISHWVGFGTSLSANNATSVPLPDLILQGGEQFQLNIGGVDVGDTLTAPRALVQEMFEEPHVLADGRVSMVDRLDSIEETLHRLR